MNLARIRRDIAAAQQYFDYVEDRATAAGSLMALIALQTSRRVYTLGVTFPESYPNAMPEVEVRKPALRWWKTACFDRCKRSTRRRMDSALRAQLLPTFGVRPLDRICRSSVHLWFDRYSRNAPGGANRTLDVLRQILNHAIACGHLTTNPTRGVTRNPRPKLTPLPVAG